MTMLRAPRAPLFTSACCASFGFFCRKGHLGPSQTFHYFFEARQPQFNSYSTTTVMNYSSRAVIFVTAPLRITPKLLNTITPIFQQSFICYGKSAANRYNLYTDAHGRPALYHISPVPTRHLISDWRAHTTQARYYLSSSQ
jgi:hypothetical protein